MAQKKKTAAKKPAAVKRSHHKKVPAPGPRSQNLPGMEQVRDARLDQLCESIGDTRDAMNRLRGEEAADERNALAQMRMKGLNTYRHAGVELARVPGEEKLRVRTSKVTATAETPDPEEATV